jgi:glycosyltransferase involved in cell wall biosynthesis
MERGPAFFHDLVSLYRWHRLMRTIKPDIVVGSTPKAAGFSMLAAKWNKIPARIYHARGFRAEGLVGILRKVAMYGEWLTARSSSAIICDGQSLLTELTNAHMFPRSKGTVLGSGSTCGVDIKHLRPASREEYLASRSDFGLLERDFVVGFVGRITIDKGVRELITAVELARKDFHEIRLVLVGPLEDASLGERIRKNTEFITNVGPVADPRSAYWAFDCFVLPSYREGLGQVSLEAQACGIPTIVSDATGVRDSVPADTRLPMVPVGDSNSIKELICSLYADESLRRETGLLGRLWVENNFESQQVIAGFNEYLSQQVENSRE